MGALSVSLLTLVAPLIAKVARGASGNLLARTLLQAGHRVVQARMVQASTALDEAAQAVMADAQESLNDLLPPHKHVTARTPLALPPGSTFASVEDSLHAAGLNALRDAEDVYQAAAKAATDQLRGAGGRTGAERAQRTLSALQATQRMMDDLANHGLTGFTDRAGRRWSLAAYSEMTIRTAASRLHLETQLALMGPAGLDLVYVDGPSAEMACSRCAPFEGQVLSLSGTHAPGLTVAATDVRGVRHQVTVAASLADARRRGFLHPMCRHSLMPFTDGAIISLAGGTRGFVRHGNAYQRGVIPDRDSPSYRAQQRHRALERAVRQWKARELVAMTPAARQHARVHSAAAAKRLADHATTFHLTRQQRQEVPGAAR